MPAGDGTGPWGTGPMTGRAAGFCAGFGAPGHANPLPGRGFGMGRGGSGGRGAWGCRGGGRGWRNRFYATGLPGWMRAGMSYGAPSGVPHAAAPTPEQELASLKQQAESLDTALATIRKRVQELEAKPAGK